MTGHFKTGAAIVALLSLGLAGAALADRGPRGGEGRGDMLLQMFDTIDADTDGKITEAEIAAHRAAEFAAADANSDGLLSAEELAQQRIARMTAQAADQSARMIERMDANGDGSLSAEEMDQTPRERRFARMDTDKDGAISKAEAEAAMERFAGGRKHGRGMGGGMGGGMGQGMMEN
jgi:Ca2+-binding EF-hand superfamily protein